VFIPRVKRFYEVKEITSEELIVEGSNGSFEIVKIVKTE